MRLRGRRGSDDGAAERTVPAALADAVDKAGAAGARYAETRDPEALDAVVDAWEGAAAETSTAGLDDDFALMAATNAGGARVERYGLRGDLADLDRAIELLRGALPRAQAAVVAPALWSTLGGALRSRFLRTGVTRDLDEGIGLLRKAVARTPQSDPVRAAFLNNLGSALTERWRHSGLGTDLEEAIELHQESVARTAMGDDGLAARLTNLGGALRYRYSLGGDAADLATAVDALWQAVALTPEGVPQRARRLTSLGSGYSDQYARWGRGDDLDAAVQVYRDAVAATPERAPEAGQRLANLAGGLAARAERTGDPAQLEEAVDLFRAALGRLPESAPERPDVLARLGSLLATRHERTGDTADLEDAIAALRQAVAALPEGSPSWASLTTALATALQDRHARTGETSDLNEAVDLIRAVALRTPPDSPASAGALANLGAILTRRFSAGRDSSDLDEAVGTLQEALALLAADSPHRGGFSTSLAQALLERFRLTSAPADLADGLEASRAAVASVPAESPLAPDFLANLGVALVTSFHASGEHADLEGAIDAYSATLERMQPESPAYFGVAYNLGSALHARAGVTGSPEDLDAAIATWDGAWRSAEGPRALSPVAYQLARLHETGLLAERLVSSYFERAGVGRRPDVARRALEVAEGAKSRILTELLGRSELPRPDGLGPEEEARERALLARLSDLDSRELRTMAGLVADPGGAGRDDQDARVEQLRERREVRGGLEDLWRTLIAAAPGAADYVALRRGETLGWEGLGALADDLGEETAVGSLFVAGQRIRLFLLRAGRGGGPEVLAVPLDDAGRQGLSRRLSRELAGSLGSDRGETWLEPLRPLLAEAAEHLEGAERLVLAPHGLGHALPWTVAAARADWRARDGGVLPVVTIPALAFLPRLRRRPPRGDAAALVVGNPTGDLPHAEAEAEAVAETLGTAALLGPQATREAVLEGLRTAAVVHLASHAVFDPAAPLDSAIFLHDGALRAHEIIEQRLDVDLLVLSACETGRAGAVAGDELAGLAHAFLHAGARSLLVSLWAVSDPATAALMRSFYAARSRGLDKAAALGAAQADLRGRPEHAHPYFWGAFTLVGDWR
jgi:tetratricopeptide (TPR) repeat protein